MPLFGGIGKLSRDTARTFSRTALLLMIFPSFIFSRDECVADNFPIR
jgi:hypothetical protein